MKGNMSKDKPTQLKKDVQVKKGKDNQANQPVDEDQSKEEGKQQEPGARHKGKEIEKQQMIEQKNQKQSQQLQLQKGSMQDQMMQSQQDQTQQIIKQDDLDTFADPTYDLTFKMLFANNEHKDILISFLNSLLGFKDANAIVSLDIIDPYLGQEYVFGIQSTIDVRCKTSSGEDISIEMQRKNKDYFVPRTQDYMAKLISTQVKEGEGQQYHIKLSNTYILVLAKQNLFTGQYKLTGDSNACYEKTFKPTCEELGNQEMPGNKMHWKFFELNKFKTFMKNQIIDDSYLLKEQWLDFLINCNNHLAIPEKINETIKEGYNIMKMANWDRDQINKYYKLKANELDEQITIDNKLEQAELQGEMKGKIKGEINTVKALLENEIGQEKIVPKLKFLPQSSINFISQHMEDSASQLYDDHYQDLIGNIEGNINMDIL